MKEESKTADNLEAKANEPAHEESKLGPAVDPATVGDDDER